MEDAQELMADPEMKELCQQTFQEAKEAKEQLYHQLQLLLLPKDPNDEKSVIVGEVAVGFPFAVSILPAIVNDDLLHMFGKNGIVCDEFSVFQHFIFGDRPAVIIPGVPAGSDIGIQ